MPRVEVLRIARSRVELGHVHFALGDAYALPVSSRGFDGAFAGFWFSHVPLARVGSSCMDFTRRSCRARRSYFSTTASSTRAALPFTRRDADGNTYQLRRLDDGSTHRVLKNFPSTRELHQAVQGVASEVRHHEWQHFWALEYSLAGP